MPGDFSRDQSASRRVGGGYEEFNPVTGTINVNDYIPDSYEASVTQNPVVDAQTLTSGEGKQALMTVVAAVVAVYVLLKVVL